MVRPAHVAALELCRERALPRLGRDRPERLQWGAALSVITTPPVHLADNGTMQLRNSPGGAVDLTATPIHLGLGARARPVDGFGWDPPTLDAYSAAVAGDGDEGRLVMIFAADAPWTTWERHPGGDEVVICLSGRMTLIQDTDGHEQRIELVAGTAAVNGAGVWHTADVSEPGQFMTITPGRGTEHRPR